MGMTSGMFPSVSALTGGPSGLLSKDLLAPFPASSAFRAPPGGPLVRSCPQQRSIALDPIPQLPIPHGLEYTLGSWMHLVVVLRRLEATISTFPRVPLTREPTCTQAFDPGASG